MITKVAGPILIFFISLYILIIRIPKIEIMVKNSNSILFPKILLIGMLITSIVIIVKLFKLNDLHFDFKFENLKEKFVLNIIFGFIYVIGIYILGFFVITPLYLFFITFFLGGKNHFFNIIYSIII